MNHTEQHQTEQPPAKKRRRRISSDPPPEIITGLIDSREQNPATLPGIKSRQATLPTGDYSALGLENYIAIERKSLEDFLACVGRERERFDRECQRLLAYPCRAIVVEATWADLERGEWRSQVTPAAAIGSALGWIAAGIPIVMAGSHERAGQFIARIIFLAARRRWREIQPMLRHMLGEEADEEGAQ